MAQQRSIPVYHYTSEEGLQGILQERRISASDPLYGDARLGPGTYGTNLPPSTRPKTIALNNWDGAWRRAMDAGKLDYYVRCEVPERELDQFPGYGQRSDGKIFVHPEGLDLDRYPTSFGVVGQPTVEPPYIASCGDGLRTSYVHDTHSESHVYAAHDDSDDDHPAVESCGYNSRGNYYESYGDGSYRYENQDGSTYEQDADGHATYTSPAGDAFEYGSPAEDAQADWPADDEPHDAWDHAELEAHSVGERSEGGHSGGGYSEGGYDAGGYSDGGYSGGGYSDYDDY
eukprot:TRINITY_DN76868_c0_g1_i1.p1 TRINITY_DN76868_c0_g1~~TRINITY_DN76868_c0_g1_i1.p1  ORF type:complete len:287 (+),score=30.59 TRINITY_DN76868_c0_g1_i1:124-984(+)